MQEKVLLTGSVTKRCLHRLTFSRSRSPTSPRSLPLRARVLLTTTHKHHAKNEKLKKTYTIRHCAAPRLKNEETKARHPAAFLFSTGRRRTWPETIDSTWLRSFQNVLCRVPFSASHVLTAFILTRSQTCEAPQGNA